MAFLKDIQDKIILGRWRFLNLKPLESTTLKPLSIDEHGNLGIGEEGASTTAWSDITDKPATFAPSAHTHSIANITGLQTALDSKQASGSYATTTELTNGLAGKANTSHTHTVAQVTGLQGELDSKADSADIPDVSGFATTSALTSGLAGKANTSHTHTIAQVTGLQGELDSKLTATQGAAVADGSTVDELLVSLRAAGLIAE